MNAKEQKALYRRIMQSKISELTGVYLWNEEPKTTELCEKILCDLCLIISASVKDYAEKHNIKL